MKIISDLFDDPCLAVFTAEGILDDVGLDFQTVLRACQGFSKD